MTELVTYHMESHNVTCHLPYVKRTHPALQPVRLEGMEG